MISMLMRAIGTCSEAWFLKVSDASTNHHLAAHVRLRMRPTPHHDCGSLTSCDESAHVPKARKPQREPKSIPQLCSYLLRFDQGTSHGIEGGVPIPVMLSEVWIRVGGGGDPCRPGLCAHGERVH